MKRRELFAGMTCIELVSMLIFIALTAVLAMDVIMQPIGY